MKKVTELPLVHIIRGYHEYNPFDYLSSNCPQAIRDGWAVFNAPCPMYASYAFTGDFRHGVHYAAIDLSPANRQKDTMLDRVDTVGGWPVLLVDFPTVVDETITAAKANPILKDLIEIEKTIRSYTQREIVQLWLGMQLKHYNQQVNRGK